MRSSEQERWKKIPGSIGTYEVSTHGRVRSKTMFTNGEWNIFQCSRLRNGYLKAMVPLESGKKCHFVHRLVFSAFVGEIPIGMVINHKDFNKANNRLENLECITRSENSLYTSRFGRGNQAEHHPFAKLKREAVAEVRRRCSLGESQQSVAYDFGISQTAVSHIVTGKAWKHPDASDRPLPQRPDIGSVIDRVEAKIAEEHKRVA